MDFSGKVCLVTGGSRGIGKAIVEALLQRGARVLFGDILYHEGEATAKEFGSRYGEANVLFFRLDVASHTNFEAAFLKCLDHFGGLDVVVNNAGINAETSWETQVDINLKGTIRGVKLALRYMGRQGRAGESTRSGGVVLNISSIQGLVSWPAMPSYSAAKSGIIAYTRCAGHHLEYEQSGLKIVCLCPFGVISPMQDFEVYTGMTDVGLNYLSQQDVKTRILSTEEVAEAALKVMRDGRTASVWYIHKQGDQAYEVPDGNTYENLLKWKPK